MTVPTQPEPTEWDLIDDLENQLDHVINSFLSRRSWKHTSKTPDSIWRWCKEINGINYMVDQKSALSIERALEDR